MEQGLACLYGKKSLVPIFWEGINLDRMAEKWGVGVLNMQIYWIHLLRTEGNFVNIVC
jgi:hypothetical protein